MSTPDWHEHERWHGVPRCTGCGQPLMHPESKRLGLCFRCRAPETSGETATAGGQAPAGEAAR